MGNCSLITEQRMRGIFCRSWDCEPCREFKQFNSEYLESRTNEEKLKDKINDFKRAFNVLDIMLKEKGIYKDHISIGEQVYFTKRFLFND